MLRKLRFSVPLLLRGHLERSQWPKRGSSPDALHEAEVVGRRYGTAAGLLDAWPQGLSALVPQLMTLAPEVLGLRGVGLVDAASTAEWLELSPLLAERLLHMGMGADACEEHEPVLRPAPRTQAGAPRHDTPGMGAPALARNLLLYR